MGGITAISGSFLPGPTVRWEQFDPRLEELPLAVPSAAGRTGTVKLAAAAIDDLGEIAAQARAARNIAVVDVSSIPPLQRDLEQRPEWPFGR